MKSLSPDIIADENISSTIISYLRSCNYNVISVREDYPGSQDSEVIRIADDNHSILLTEDRDFGEWVFSHRIKNSGVLFLRYHYSEREKIVDMLLKVLVKYSDTLYGKFTVITPDKIRIREI